MLGVLAAFQAQSGEAFCMLIHFYNQVNLAKLCWHFFALIFALIIFPASPKEQLVLSEKILKEHSSNLSSFILMYCTASGSNPAVVVWCYLSPQWHPQLLLASGKEDKWLLCSGAMRGLLCLHLVSIVVVLFRS